MPSPRTGAVVESWADVRYSQGEDWHDAYHIPQLMVFGLGSAELVSKHARRMSLVAVWMGRC